MYLIFLLVLWFKCSSSGIPPGLTLNTENSVEEDISSLKYTTKMLADQLEKWNNLFLTSLEPRMSLATTSLASIDSNVNNLQERAHVWDTFQLHVSAWNEQLATLDRKVDIISRGQEKLLTLESKIDSIVNTGYKIDDVIARIDGLEESLSNLKHEIQSKYYQENRDVLFEEFAARGILSSIKNIEKKLDRLQQLRQKFIITQNGEEKSRLTVKCNTRFLEEILNDVSSKVDVIFDRVNDSEDNDGEYDTEEYIDGRDNNDLPLEIRTVTNGRVSKKINNITLQELSDSIKKIEDMSHMILEKEDHISKGIDGFNINSSFVVASVLHDIEENGIRFNENFNNIMDSYFNELRAYFDSSFQKILVNTLTQNSKTENSQETKPLQHVPLTERDHENIFLVPTKQGCEDIDENQTSGIYLFGNVTDYNSNNRSYNKKYCMIRDDGSWTVLQRRDNFFSPQNFNLSWFEYKHGFGYLDRDFWFGNDFICKFSLENDLLLRIELEDFNGNTAWAEYSVFKVFSEGDLYRLIVGIYKGNASDSFSSHNNTFFSTYDHRNDQAPKCCPGAVSYGGGWWFNSCLESNLNGIYYKIPQSNGYFGGIIWEQWLGNYSLKKSVMMAKPTRPLVNKRKTSWPFYEDP